MARQDIIPYQFKPGQAPNPTGRQGQAYHEVQSIARAASPAAIMRLIELMGDSDTRVAFMAAEAVLNRGYGKPKEVSDEKPPAPRIDVSKLSREELKLMESMFEKVLGQDAALQSDPMPGTQEIVEPISDAGESD